MSNVVPLPQWKPRHFTSAESLLYAVREQQKGDQRTITQLAGEVGVSSSTIYNFRSGKTRWPRPTTLFPLLKALGLRMRLEVGE
jgi:transcriptional regulator with XRE-family HTH domain